MAIQKGFLHIRGRLGDLIFYKRLNKDVVRNKASEKPQTENSKRSARDFGTASKYGAYIRQVFHPLVIFYGEASLMNRLNSRLIAVLKTIPKEKAGAKKLIDGNISLLTGFEFNQATPFSKLWLKPTEFNIVDRQAIRLSLPEENLRNLVKPYAKATHIILQAIIFNFELDGDEYEEVRVKDLSIPLNLDHFSGKALNVTLNLNGDRAVLIALGVHYTDDSAFGGVKQIACKIAHAIQIRDGQIVNFVEVPKEKIIPEPAPELLDWDDL